MISDVLFLFDILYSIIILRNVFALLAASKSHDCRWCIPYFFTYHYRQILAVS